MGTEAWKVLLKPIGFRVEDATQSRASAVGLWTEAHRVTRFDDFVFDTK